MLKSTENNGGKLENREAERTLITIDLKENSLTIKNILIERETLHRGEWKWRKGYAVNKSQDI